MWDAASGDLVWSAEHANEANAVAFDPRGELLASAALDGTVRIWRAGTGEVVRVLRGHAGGITGLAFSPDGTLLASTSQDRTTRLWDVDTGRNVLLLAGHTATVSNPAFFPDGRHLATIAEDGTIRISTLDVAELLEIARARVTRTFSAQECAQYGIEPCPE